MIIIILFIIIIIIIIIFIIIIIIVVVIITIIIIFILGSDHYISTNFKKTLWGTISDFPDFYISLSTRCK